MSSISNWLERMRSRKKPTIQDLEQLENHIMSAISEFAARVDAHQQKIDEAVSDVSGDVSDLKALIEQLQTTPGPITPEDQALLDQIEGKAAAAAEKLVALAAETPPPPPVEE